MEPLADGEGLTHKAMDKALCETHFLEPWEPRRDYAQITAKEIVGEVLAVVSTKPHVQILHCSDL